MVCMVAKRWASADMEKSSGRDDQTQEIFDVKGYEKIDSTSTQAHRQQTKTQVFLRIVGKTDAVNIEMHWRVQ